MLEQSLSSRAANASTAIHSHGNSAFRPNLAAIVVGVFAVATSFAVGGGAAGLLGAGLALVMLAIAVVDSRSFVIPDPLNVAGALLGIVNAVVLEQGNLATLAEGALRAVVVLAAFFGLRHAYVRFRRRHGIGLGDVKLAAVAGIWLDWWTLPIAIEIAALSALAIYALRRYVLRHGLRPTSRLPFGLFFAPAIWIGWLLQTVAQSGS